MGSREVDLKRKRGAGGDAEGAGACRTGGPHPHLKEGDDEGEIDAREARNDRRDVARLEQQLDELRKHVEKDKSRMEKQFAEMKQKMEKEYKKVVTELSKANVKLGEGGAAALEELAAQGGEGRRVLFAMVAKLIEEGVKKESDAASFSEVDDLSSYDDKAFVEASGERCAPLQELLSEIMSRISKKQTVAGEEERLILRNQALVTAAFCQTANPDFLWAKMIALELVLAPLTGSALTLDLLNQSFPGKVVQVERIRLTLG